MVPIELYNALLAQNAELSAQIAAGNAQIADLIGQIARLTDRVTELSAAAARSKRGTKPPGPQTPPPPPPTLPEDQQKAFEERPRPPELPERKKAAPKPRRPKGRNPLPEHLPADESSSKPCACGRCGGTRLDVVDSFDEEKLTVVKEHQRRRVVHRFTARCRDCGTRTTGEAPRLYANVLVWLKQGRRR